MIDGTKEMHQRTKTGRGIVLLGHYPQVTVKEMERVWKLKRTLLTKEAKKAKIAHGIQFDAF